MKRRPSQKAAKPIRDQIELRTRVRAYCLAEFEKMTGRPWTEAIANLARPGEDDQAEDTARKILRLLRRAFRDAVEFADAQAQRHTGETVARLLQDWANREGRRLLGEPLMQPIRLPRRTESPSDSNSPKRRLDAKQKPRSRLVYTWDRHGPLHPKLGLSRIVATPWGDREEQHEIIESRFLTDREFAIVSLLADDAWVRRLRTTTETWTVERVIQREQEAMRKVIADVGSRDVHRGPVP